MKATTLSLEDIYSNIEASIDELEALDPELASKMKGSISLVLAKNEKMKTNKLYQEMK